MILLNMKRFQNTSAPVTARVMTASKKILALSIQVKLLATFHFIIVFAPFVIENLLIRIEDGPETACSTTNRSVLTLLRYHVCTEIKYTIQHKSGKECDLYIKGVTQYRQGYSASPPFAMQ